jgi:predicted permease
MMEPAEALRGANRSSGERASLPQRSLIVFQAALSLVLLVSAGLLTRSLRNMEQQDFGLDTTNRFVLHLNPASAGYKAERLETLHQALEQEFAEIPGMQSVGLALYAPLDGNQWTFDVFIPGRPAPGPNDDATVLMNRVSPNFLESVGQPVVRGRGFTQADNADSQPVALVDQAFVKKFFPREDPIGRHFSDTDQQGKAEYEIVGVVADAKYTKPREQAQAMYFRPLSQWQLLKDPVSMAVETQAHYINALVMRFHGQPQNLEAGVRRALSNVDPNLTIIDLHSFDYQVTGNFNQERLIARLATLFGLLTLLLATVGLYGLTSYQVNQRSKEIGLRMALGADRKSVVRLVMRGALVQVGLGMALGVPTALLGARLIADQLYGLTPYDPLSLGVSVAVLSAAAAIAGCIPARRAASIEPTRALRLE